MPDLHILLVALDSDIEVAAKDDLVRKGADVTDAASFEQAEQAFADAADAETPIDVAVFAHSRPQAVDAENAAIAALSASPGCEIARFILLSDDRRDRTHLVLPNCTILPKRPFSRTALVRAVLDAVGRSDTGGAPAHSPEESTARPSADDPVAGLILIAEDNVINQLVLQRQLEEFGYLADIAADGEEAFEAYQRGNYRLLLVDCHMPNMDGYALTQAIRQKERETGRRIPIVAISADAEQDNVGHCLDAGMDDYLFKPVELGDLGATLDRWLGDDAGAEGADMADTVPIPSDVVMYEDMQTDVPIDLTVLARLLGTDDNAYLGKMVKAYWDSMRDTASELNKFFDYRDASKLRDAAHTAKGASASVGAVTIASLLKELQLAATDADWGQIKGLMPKIESEFTKLEQYVETIQAA